MSSTLIFTIFGLLVMVLLAIDVFVAHPPGREVTIRSALIWSVVWIAAGVGFGVAVMYPYGGTEAVTKYLTAYAVEKTLSVDNVFLWLLVFSGMAVPKAYQRRVLVFGVVGAVLLRTLLILAGTAIVERFTFVLIIAGVFLVIAGVKLWFEREEEGADEHASDPALLRILRRILPSTDGWRGEKFVVHEGGAWKATPLLFVLILIELTDVVLALDALPAGLSITTDVNIILTSNLFAVLGLRSLYFMLVGVLERIHYLKAAVGVVLLYIGVTLLLEQLLEGFHPSTLVTLGIIVFVFGVAVWASLRREKRLEAQQIAVEEPTAEAEPPNDPSS